MTSENTNGTQAIDHLPEQYADVLGLVLRHEREPDFKAEVYESQMLDGLTQVFADVAARFNISPILFATSIACVCASASGEEVNGEVVPVESKALREIARMIIEHADRVDSISEH